MKKLCIYTGFLFACLFAYGQQQVLPEITSFNGVKQLIVDGKPFIMLAGELYNSASSSLEYMQPVWGKHAGRGKNIGFTYAQHEKDNFTLSYAGLSVTVSRNGGKIISFKRSGKEMLT
ncbi:MAG: hypothetical protein LBS79_08090 [Tannerella sp.]|jgi:hypothetical protein|nr:hypothetical protein [Tannerella sp.]